MVAAECTGPLWLDCVQPKEPEPCLYLRTSAMNVRGRLINVLIAVLLVAPGALAQPVNFWNVLAEVGFQKKKDANGFDVDVPQFSAHLKTYDRKTIQLKGFVIPMDEAGSGKFMFSMLPFNLCYFCGAAGPETVVEVEGPQAIAFTTQSIVLEGTLRLNASNPDRHIYILQNARLIKK